MAMASCEHLGGAVAVFAFSLSVLVERELLLVIAQLPQQAFAQSAAAHARRIELANHFEGFLEVGRV